VHVLFGLPSIFSSGFLSSFFLFASCLFNYNRFIRYFHVQTSVRYFVHWSHRADMVSKHYTVH
jgi:hypothetical protein